MNQTHCVNCGIATTRSNAIGRRSLNDDNSVLSVIRQWASPLTVEDNQVVCQACWNHASRTLQDEASHSNTPPSVGHRQVCFNCGHSVLRVRFHQLRDGGAQEARIYNVIREWVMPRTIGTHSVICHSCWVRADRVAGHYTSRPSTSSAAELPTSRQELGPSSARAESSTDSSPEPPELHDVNVPRTPDIRPLQVLQAMILPDYIRANETESRCFIEGCRRQERNRIPIAMRKMLLNNYNYYVPVNNRLCDRHLTNTSWDFLSGLVEHYISAFTPNHVQDMLSLLKTPSASMLDFENTDVMEDHIFYYWLGFTKEQFNDLLNEVPQFLRFKKYRTTLAAYLIKLRNGDSNERISSLFKIPRSTLESMIAKARETLYDYFVPHHLGFNHINRNQIMERNLQIPNALFGHVDNGDMKPIIICDGTYCYIQKSSNYLYQKKTYSLHKYRNLVKPFLMVCTDGHIVDVLGPYPATTSDAEIMKKEFRKPEVREYIQPGDALILNRGFRDALPILNEYGYRTFVPASLQEGETQLSTIEANKSRAVTICRWVVEIVNGRFKRDFRIFRQEYFNISSKHLMINFEVAAALINRFHPPLIDRDDAGEIIQLINQYMFVDNRLANFVETNNMNRRRANFISLTINNDDDTPIIPEFPQLSYNELILVALGTYQLKQARSYYGEHLRENGAYSIEVCKEVDRNQLRELSNSDNLWMLRGRILSRHISRKTYFVYVLIDSSLRGRGAIIQYCCNCIVGRRTVGCCAHVMSILWYLAWARYQEHISPPAQFLDNILIVYDDEEDQ